MIVINYPSNRRVSVRLSVCMYAVCVCVRMIRMKNSSQTNLIKVNVKYP